jgi:DegV family protein with EDD domain
VISLKEKFSALVADGSDVIYLAITSKLSGCYSAGCLAKEIVEGDFPGVKIAVIDTMAGSMGHGWAVIRAAMMAKEGYSFEEIVSVVEESRKGLHHYITVDDLSALIRGGRISKGVGLLANTLGIKPIITVIDGAMVPYPKGAKQRGMKKCLARIIEIISEDIVVNEKTKVAVCYAMDTDKSDMFIKLFEERFGRGVDMLTRIGCSIGVHGGHTAFAVFIDDYDAMSV